MTDGGEPGVQSTHKPHDSVHRCDDVYTSGGHNGVRTCDLYDVNVALYR